MSNAVSLSAAYYPDNSGRRLHWRVGTAAHARQLARALVAAADEIEQLDEVTR